MLRKSIVFECVCDLCAGMPSLNGKAKNSNENGSQKKKSCIMGRTELHEITTLPQPTLVVVTTSFHCTRTQYLMFRVGFNCLHKLQNRFHNNSTLKRLLPTVFERRIDRFQSHSGYRLSLVMTGKTDIFFNEPFV